MAGERFYKLKVEIATWRRVLLIVLIIIPTIFFSGYIAHLLPHQGSTKVELLIIMIFTLLFSWITTGFWTALIGFFTLVRRFNQFTSAHKEDRTIMKRAAHPHTAVLMPICNEDPTRVFAGIGAVYQSLKDAGNLDHFDLFILSDTNDPDGWVEEEWCWFKLCDFLGAFDKIFYRRRKIKIKRKSGNIADFCRRWGRAYRYMIILDADSIMTGNTLMLMVEIMEQNNHVGILQTVPKVIGRDSLFARLQQFSNNVYGPIFAAGLHFWQLGDAHFWGHNAIIRVEPFMNHCALPKLPGKPPLGGEILSHDFVEAALMRRAGLAVWLAYNLEGSYEEAPPTLLDALKRDRRWCQGNLQHLRLLFTEGLCPAHRAMFINGAMSYISSPIWFLFLGICTLEVFYKESGMADYFPETRSLFPDWPIWHPERSLILIITIGIILFLPKLLGVLFIFLNKKSIRKFGGGCKLVLSMVVETIFSALLAPVYMLFHSKFVVITLLGKQIGWYPQRREESGTSWMEGLRFHWVGTLLGLVWATATFLINKTFFLWMTPVFAALLLSIPFSVWSSRSETGRRLRKKGILVIPEELEPPQELRSIKSISDRLDGIDQSLGVPKVRGFVRAIVEPFINDLHISLLGRERKISTSLANRRCKLRDKALIQGPDQLIPSEKLELLYDPVCMADLHRAVWELPYRFSATKWGLTELPSLVSLKGVKNPSFGYLSNP